MLFLAFDKAWLQHYEQTQYEAVIRKRREALKLIKGGKEND
jgi:uncharacterized protein YjcR